MRSLLADRLLHQSAADLRLDRAFFWACCAAAAVALEEARPVQTAHGLAGERASLLDREPRDLVDDPLEVVLAHRMQVRVRRRIHEIDRVRDAVFHRKLNRVQVVAERLAQRQRILFHAREQAGSYSGGSIT